ncbi:hypothetical protein [Agrobacterium larrymoorei]|uniref:Chorismate-pyruvate lyase n=1 Tax=Agrobacterium larrymoorei TaxID=160699 RepID=A0ABU0UMI5_9HYPH|nr:hypothetical protein [Agrobacterium larrymoorei]MDQ1185993.1 chorismate-pyruvate lyase [Agrobacterium larrymoorei]
MSSFAFKALICNLAISMSGQALAAQASWPDTPVSRLAALATVQDLSIQLLSQDSATLTLEHWCADHKLAEPAKISAIRLKDTKTAPDEVRRQLNVSGSDPLGYRHVLLKCGDLVLSEADNWYVPDRLTTDMNQTLDTTDTPFGKAVLPLHFQRHTVSSQLIWQPLPEHWEMGQVITPGHSTALDVPETLITNEAVLTKPDGTPISFVIENYKSALLSFPPPSIAH